MRNIGIWIDQKEAIISDGASVLHHINSGIEGLERIPGEGNDGSRFGNQFIDPEKKREARKEAKEKEFFTEVMEKLKPEDSLVVFGPAQTKIHLAKAITENLRPTTLQVETTDNMTENQKVAWVREYFGL